jgi:nucleotide-binding universal stress UspA family protein
MLPNLRLDGLLDELQVRLQAVVATRDRVNALFEAVVAIGTNLDIEVVLRGIVEAAVTLVDASYGAMGVIGNGGRLAEFIPAGLTEEQIGRRDAGLIAMGSRGRGDLAGLLLGSTAHKVIHLADGPVLVVPELSADSGLYSQTADRQHSAGYASRSRTPTTPSA